MRLNRNVVAFIAILAIAPLAVTTPVAGNLWSLATNRGYFIPPESSLFSFRVTKENDGSGEWWLYGEDDHQLFAADPVEPFYISASRAVQARCPQFKPDDATTWCAQTRHRVPAR